METTKQKGDKGENKAAEFLESLGYEIIDRNWRNRFGEIDIIAEKDEVLVFIEVKAKGDSRFGSPAEMITKRKLHKLKNAATSYLNESEYRGAWRIDAVVIEGDKPDIIENITL